MNSIRCPNCQNKVLQKSEDKIRLRTHGAVTFAEGSCSLRCYFCKTSVELPLDLVKSTSAPERLVIRAKQRS